MLERYLIRYFLAVVDHASFSRAAEHCRVSQPTLSVGIAKLETLLGTTLFDRSSRRVRATSAGTRFLAHARRIESEFNLAQASTEVQPLAVVRLGVLHSIAGAELARIARAALALNPDERFELVPGTARELTAKLTRGRIDAALTIMAEAGGRIVERPLRTEAFALALSTHHPLAGQPVLTAEDVAGDPMIVRRHCESLPLISRHFSERGIQPHFSMRATNDERVLQMIEAGLGVTVMPDSYAQDGVAMRPLAGLDIRRTTGLAFSGDRPLPQIGDTGILAAVVQTLGQPGG